MRTLFFAIAVAACGGSGGSATSVDAPGSGGGSDAPVPPSNWSTVASHYGKLFDLAGAGATDTQTNEWSVSFEGQSALGAELSRPHMAAADSAGNIYIADKEAHAIRKVTPAGVITTVAGTGIAGAADDTPGPATQRALANPNGLFVRADGTLYIVDLDHGRIRKVQGGMMTTLVTVPGGISTGRGLWVDGADGSERVFFSSGNVVKRWTAANGVTSYATGFVNLGNIAMDGTRLLVSDRGGNRVYAVTEANGMITKTPVAGNGSTGAGVDGAAALSTPLEGVRAVWPAHGADGGGFFAGTHEGCQLWFVDAAGIAHLFVDGEKDAHAGVGEDYNTPGKKLSELRSVTLDAAGNVIIVDDDRGFVRRVERE
jgi:serine/threonine-protein kinase